MYRDEPLALALNSTEQVAVTLCTTVQEACIRTSSAHYIYLKAYLSRPRPAGTLPSPSSCVMCASFSSLYSQRRGGMSRHNVSNLCCMSKTMNSKLRLHIWTDSVYTLAATWSLGH